VCGLFVKNLSDVCDELSTLNQYLPSDDNHILVEILFLLWRRSCEFISVDIATDKQFTYRNIFNMRIRSDPQQHKRRDVQTNTQSQGTHHVQENPRRSKQDANKSKNCVLGGQEQ
jgi:hypothetical protein